MKKNNQVEAQFKSFVNDADILNKAVSYYHDLEKKIRSTEKVEDISEPVIAMHTIKRGGVEYVVAYSLNIIVREKDGDMVKDTPCTYIVPGSILVVDKERFMNVSMFKKKQGANGGCTKMLRGSIFDGETEVFSMKDYSLWKVVDFIKTNQVKSNAELTLANDKNTGYGQYIRETLGYGMGTKSNRFQYIVSMRNGLTKKKGQVIGLYEAGSVADILRHQAKLFNVEDLKKPAEGPIVGVETGTVYSSGRKETYGSPKNFVLGRKLKYKLQHEYDLESADMAIFNVFNSYAGVLDANNSLNEYDATYLKSSVRVDANAAIDGNIKKYVVELPAKYKDIVNVVMAVKAVDSVWMSGNMADIAYVPDNNTLYIKLHDLTMHVNEHPVVGVINWV